MEQIKTLEQALKYIKVQQKENSIAIRHQYELQDECDRLKQLSQELAEQLEQNRNQGGTSHDSVRLVFLEEKNQELENRLIAMINLLNKIQTDMGSLQTDYSTVMKEHQQMRDNVSDAVPADRLMSLLQNLSSHIERQDSQISDLKIRNAQLELADSQLMTALVEKQQLEKQLAKFQSLQAEYDGAVQLISNQGIAIDTLKAKVKQMAAQIIEYQKNITQLEQHVKETASSTNSAEDKRVLTLMRDRAQAEEQIERLEAQKALMKEIMEKQVQQDLAVNLLQERLDNLQIQANRDNCMALRESAEQNDLAIAERIHVSSILKNAAELFQVIQHNQSADKHTIQLYEDEVQNYRKHIAEINLLSQKSEAEQLQLQNHLERRIRQQAYGNKLLREELQNLKSDYFKAFSGLELRVTELQAQLDKFAAPDAFDNRIQRLEDVNQQLREAAQKWIEDASGVVFEQLVERAERGAFEKLLELRLQLSDTVHKLPGFENLALQEGSLAGEVINVAMLVSFTRNGAENLELERQKLEERLRIFETSAGATDEVAKRLSDEKVELQKRVLDAELKVKDLEVLKQENEALKLKNQELYDMLQAVNSTQRRQFAVSAAPDVVQNTKLTQGLQEYTKSQNSEFSSPKPVPLRARHPHDVSVASLNPADLKRTKVSASQSPRKEVLVPMSTSMASTDSRNYAAVSPDSKTTSTMLTAAPEGESPRNNRLARLTQNVLNGRAALDSALRQNSTTDRLIQMSVHQ